MSWRLESLLSSLGFFFSLPGRDPIWLVSNFQKICALDLADDVSAAILSPHLSLIVYNGSNVVYTIYSRRWAFIFQLCFCATYINDYRHKQPSMFSTIAWNLKPKIFPERLMSTLIAKFSLRIQPFLLAPRRQGRLARRNVCDSVTEIPYWRCKSMFT